MTWSLGFLGLEPGWEPTGAGYFLDESWLSCGNFVVDKGSADLDQLTAGWWEYRRLAQGSRSERKTLELGEPVLAWAARMNVEDLVGAGGVEALRVVLALLETAPDSSGVALVASGSLEDLLYEHGDALADEFDRLVRQSPLFRQAMACVWLSSGVLNPDTERRLRRWVSPRQDDR